VTVSEQVEVPHCANDDRLVCSIQSSLDFHHGELFLTVRGLVEIFPQKVALLAKNIVVLL
jgi:hypothetical protein